MREILAITFVFILTACSAPPPQATVTSPPPIATPVPAKETPTPESTPTETAISGPSPEQIAARIAEINTEFRGFYEVNADGQFYAIDQTTGETTYHPEFGIHLGTGDLTWTHYSELLGRELTEPVADLRMDYKMDANNKMVYTGAFETQNCYFDGKECHVQYVKDPETGKNVAPIYSTFEVMMLLLEDKEKMTEQDIKNAFTFGQESFEQLEGHNRGKRSLRYIDESGVEHVWKLYFPGNGRSGAISGNQISVSGEGLIRPVPKFIFEGIGSDGKTSFIVWEVGEGTDNKVRREIFFGEDSVTNFDITTLVGNPFELEREWLPGEYELIPFD